MPGGTTERLKARTLAAKGPGPEVQSRQDRDPGPTSVLDLQRSAGNQATTQAVGPQPEDKVATDNRRLKERIARIHAFKDGKLAGYLDQYVRHLTQGEDERAMAELDLALDELDRVRAFEIPFHLHNYWWGTRVERPSAGRRPGGPRRSTCGRR